MKICYDLETTGFTKFRNGPPQQILEIGYLRYIERQDPRDDLILDGGLIHLWDPDWIIQKGAEDVHGLTRELMTKLTNDADPMLYIKNLAKVYSLFYNADVVGKNNQAFDDKLLMSLLKRVFYRDTNLFINSSYDYGKEYRGWFSEKVPGKNRQGQLHEHCELRGINADDINQFIDTYIDIPDNIKKLRNTYHSALFDAVATYLCRKGARIEERG